MNVQTQEVRSNSDSSNSKTVPNFSEIKSEFDKACYKLVYSVPAGKVTTYKDVARALGSKAYRAVGRAMAKNPFAPVVPCHRVVASDGQLGGFAFGIDRKCEILIAEGIKINSGKVKDLELFRYNWPDSANNRINGFFGVLNRNLHE